MADKVLFLTQYFYPEVATTAQLLTELAVELRKFELEVAVFTGQPSYRKTKKLPRKEDYRRVCIQRLFNTRFNKDKTFGRVANSLTFFFSALLRVLFTRRDKTLFIVSNPPFLALIGWLMKRIRGQKYIYLVHDVYPDIAVKLGYLPEGGLITKMWDKLNHRIYCCADAIVVLGDYMRETIESKLTESCTKGANIHVIHNWANGDFIKPLAKEENWFCQEYDLVGKRVVLYSGNLGLFHDLETIVEAAEQLQGFDDLLFLFIGEGGKKKKLMEVAQKKGLRNVQFLPYQPWEHLPYSLTCGDISIVTVEKGVESLGVPSKLYTSLAAGQAILGLVGENSEVAGVIREYHCGIRVDQGDVEGVVNILKKLYEDPQLLVTMKKNARRCFEENFTREQAIEKYYAVLSNL